MWQIVVNILWALALYVLSVAVFGLAVWMVLPVKQSPFRDGLGRGMRKCLVFCLVTELLFIGLVVGLGFLGVVVGLVIYYLAVVRVFEAKWLDAFWIILFNGVLWLGVEWLLTEWLASG